MSRAGGDLYDTLVCVYYEWAKVAPSTAEKNEEKVADNHKIEQVLALTKRLEAALEGLRSEWRSWRTRLRRQRQQ